MKANTPIHLVKRKNYDALNDIHALFDTKEKATQFVYKIKYRPAIKITNGLLYPNYSVDIKLLSTLNPFHKQAAYPRHF